MRDTYLYEDVPVLKNKLNIRDEKQLDKAEADITYIKLLDIDNQFNHDEFDYKRLKNIHRYIFEDIYDWAGQERVLHIVKGERIFGGDTVRYSLPDNIENDAIHAIKKLNDINWHRLGINETASVFSILIAQLWQSHPFREGNTRAIMTFAIQFANYYNFPLNKQLLREHSNYVRDALVKASDGQYSEHEYLIKIIKDAILKG